MTRRREHTPNPAPHVSYRLRACAAVLAGLALGCGGPLGPIPGGALSGVEVACPDAFPSDVREIQIEVRPENPHSVTTWNVVLNGALFVPADFLNPVKRWPSYVEADERVRVRVGALVYACRALRVRDPGRIDALRSAAAAKYDLDPDGAAATTEVWWYRIQRR